MMGKNANYVPGWDCHGLPIEWKIEENYRKKKKSKDDIPVVEFRKECRLGDRNGGGDGACTHTAWRKRRRTPS